MGDSKIPGGYILLSRKLLESGIMEKPPIYFKLWALLLLEAQHKDGPTLKRGQVFTSIPKLQERLAHKVGYRKEQPSKKQIWGILEWLRNPYEGDTKGYNGGAMIETTKVTHGMVVTVCNYGFYQAPENYEGNSEGRTKVTTKVARRYRQGNNNNKNVKECKNVEEKPYRQIQHLSVTEDEHKKLVEEFGGSNVTDVYEAMENYAKLKNYKSGYLTARAWLRKRQENEPEKKKKSPYADLARKRGWLCE